MRRYGILLHISSLPSAYGIGDMGPAAHAFAAGLAEAGASVWQFLPLNPTSTFIGNSPYSSASAFAGNPLFISPDLLVSDGYLSRADLETSLRCLPGCGFGPEIGRVDYELVSRHREHILSAAFERNCRRLAQDAAFQAFCRDHDAWVHDHALFVSLKEAHGGVSWVEWPDGLKLRDAEALAQWEDKASMAITREKFIQFLFFSQWMRLRAACNAKGISLLADVPIYVTHDSADVWTNPDYFNLDADMRPITVAGVPPDYFSETGQRWGNPVYCWDAMRRDGFAWWKKRLAHVLCLADAARLDHFRGFCGYWE
ncbi:MAG: 4-alpha-glucanotransferase, partial [Desulfovibrio sp.]|nr:4-alpha-glucanotransferase [Desulfovibrio sp.]